MGQSTFSSLLVADDVILLSSSGGDIQLSQRFSAEHVA